MPLSSQQVFRVLPSPLQGLALEMKGWTVARRRYGGAYPSTLDGYLMRGVLPSDQIGRYRDWRLASFCRYARGTIPFYGSSEYVGLDEVQELEDLKGFPLLTKDVLRGQPEAFTAPWWKRGHIASTSGTTGAKLRFPYPRSTEHEQWAVWWRYRMHHGIQQTMWCGHFSGKEIAHRGRNIARFDRSQRRLLFGAYARSDMYLDSVLDALMRFRPPWIHGYPTFISAVSARAISQGVSKQFGTAWVTVGAGNVLRGDREVIAEGFGVQPLQHYGLAEGVANISECPSNRLHVDEDFAAVEFVDGRIIGTNFTNLAFPLIRYDTGDLATLGSKGCECGVAGRVVGDLDGRSTDYLRAPNGSLIGPMNQVVKEISGHVALQFVQNKDFSIDVNFVPAPGAQADDNQIRIAIGRRTDAKMTIRVTSVDAIAPGPNGKTPLVVQHDKVG